MSGTAHGFQGPGALAARRGPETHDMKRRAETQIGATYILAAIAARPMQNGSACGYQELSPLLAIPATAE